jgi:OOP family OmpA-OmpF porin
LYKCFENLKICLILLHKKIIQFKICLTLKKKIMNYSTLKKGLAASFVALIGVTTLANAQDASTTSSAKVFGGRGQYRSWSIGVNGGVLSPFVAIGGTNDFKNADVNLGYGISLRKQLGHAFGLEGNIFRGKISGTNKDAVGGVQNGVKEFETEVGYAADIRGVVNVATVDFLRRQNSVNFFVSAGYGLIAYAPKVTNANGSVVDWKDKATGPAGDKHDAKTYVKEAYIPVGVGVKFKVSERVSFNLGYTMHFLDNDNLDGVYANGASNKDKFSYGSAGLEFSLGSKSKPNLDWVNPLALMYDELKDPSLRQEVDALKNRVANVEKSVEDLKKDSDGDGVADQFDKCPGTPAGTAVDGSGCPLPKVEAQVTTPVSSITGFETIQFEFNSSVLKTDSYPTLDKLSSVLRENGGKVTVKGYASSEGTDAYNLKLSKDRANSVKTYLVNSGVNASQVATKGLGEANPIASNDTEEGRIQNRRVESSRN